MRIVLTGGGTGGHIYPAISIAQALREAAPEAELLFVGSSHGPEGRIACDAGLTFRAVASSSLTKSISARNAVSLMRLMAGVFRARRILKEFRPDVAIGTGGYTTAAVLVAQRSLGGRIVIHEQNAIPGRTNRWLARIADQVCVTFEGSAKSFPSGKVVLTGLPIRSEFSKLTDKREARRRLNLAEDAFTILAVGGSQGARRLNELLIGAWPAIDDGATQVLHQVGDRNLEETRQLLRDAAPSPGGEGRGEGAMERRYHIEPYINTPVAMAAADLVVSRSGASTVAEITACGLPSILIPYPYGVALEQKANAAYLVDRDAAILCEQAACTSEQLAEVITGLRAAPAKLNEMSAAARAIGKPDAAKAVARIALGTASNTQ